MKIDKFNCEGYKDLTVYKALTNIYKEEKVARGSTNSCLSDGYRPLVYICSPFRGDIEKNIENARRYSRFAIKSHVIPMTPHLLYPQFMNDNDPEERYLATHTINYVLLGKCSELWVFGNKISDGMKHEMKLAKKRKMKIKYFTEDLKEVL